MDDAAGKPRAAAVAPPSMITHYLRYSTTNVLVLLAGFVSFPVLTRLLDNTQYGVLGYYDTWVMVFVAVVKLGAQHAVLRFYPFGGDPRQLERFGTNLVTLPTLLSLALWCVAALALAAIDWLGRAEFPAVFWCVVLLAPVLVVNSVVTMVARASERSGLVMATRIGGRWLELALVLGAVIMIDRSALAVYGGKIAASLLLLCYLASWAYRNIGFSRQAMDLSAMRQALRYGLPLMANELVAVVLVALDRILLKQMTGDFAVVGIYTIGYSLAMQINVFMNASLSEAFVPVVNRVYGRGGESAVRALKDRVLLPMTYASIGIAAMIIAVGDEALVALSGPGKAASGSVFIVVGTTLALFPLLDISSYGLLLKKRSMRTFATTAIAAAVNVGMNLVLIPRYGYMGAAWATVISYVVLSGTRYLWSPRGLVRFPDVKALGLAISCALLLVVVIEGGALSGIVDVWMRLLAAGGAFAALYLLPVWLLDERMRRAVKSWLAPAA